MSVVHETISAAQPKTCKELADVFVKVVAARSTGYEGCRLIFDNYARTNSVKDIMRHGHCQINTGAFHVADATPIQNAKTFLASNTTKDALTLYLAEKVLLLKKTIVTVTRLHV